MSKTVHVLVLLAALAVAMLSMFTSANQLAGRTWRKWTVGLVHEHVTVKGDVDVVFNYLAQFDNTLEWDPGVVAATHEQAGEPLQVGSSFALTTVWKGSESSMVYALQSLDPEAHRMVLTGNAGLVSAVDTITCTAATDGPAGDADPGPRTNVDYKLELSLKGVLKPFVGLIAADLAQLGKDAMAGLTAACADQFGHHNGGASKL